ncbi:MAG: hypothetical protein M1831_005692 [Alyxoria varia]|nr:MAG: hypothetical protein M1831_005692 [Alyxoria varia]
MRAIKGVSLWSFVNKDARLGTDLDLGMRAHILLQLREIQQALADRRDSAGNAAPAMHLALHPGNVLLDLANRDWGGYPTVRLIDFGHAQLWDPSRKSGGIPAIPPHLDNAGNTFLDPMEWYNNRHVHNGRETDVVAMDKLQGNFGDPSLVLAGKSALLQVRQDKYVRPTADIEAALLARSKWPSDDLIRQVCRRQPQAPSATPAVNPGSAAASSSARVSPSPHQSQAPPTVPQGSSSQPAPSTGVVAAGSESAAPAQHPSEKRERVDEEEDTPDVTEPPSKRQRSDDGETDAPKSLPVSQSHAAEAMLEEDRPVPQQQQQQEERAQEPPSAQIGVQQSPGPATETAPMGSQQQEPTAATDMQPVRRRRRRRQWGDNKYRSRWSVFVGYRAPSTRLNPNRRP